MNRLDHWFGAGRTETGRVRLTNQDAFAVLNDHMVWLVADGMGGHPAGDVAARMAVTSIARAAKASFPSGRRVIDDPSRLLSEWIIAANREVYEQSLAKPELTGMGTTVVAMTITCSRSPNCFFKYASPRW